MANVGLPGTSGFVGEFLTLMGAFKANTWVATLATTSVILSAAYALWLYRRVVFGTIIHDNLTNILDCNKREIAIFVPLIILTILFGVYPAPILDTISASVDGLLTNYQAALSTAQAPALQ